MVERARGDPRSPLLDSGRWTARPGTRLDNGAPRNFANALLPTAAVIAIVSTLATPIATPIAASIAIPLSMLRAYFVEAGALCVAYLTVTIDVESGFERAVLRVASGTAFGVRQLSVSVGVVLVEQLGVACVTSCTVFGLRQFTVAVRIELLEHGRPSCIARFADFLGGDDTVAIHVSKINGAGRQNVGGEKDSYRGGRQGKGCSSKGLHVVVPSG